MPGLAITSAHVPEGADVVVDGTLGGHRGRRHPQRHGHRTVDGGVPPLPRPRRGHHRGGPQRGLRAAPHRWRDLPARGRRGGPRARGARRRAAPPAARPAVPPGLPGTRARTPSRPSSRRTTTEQRGPTSQPPTLAGRRSTSSSSTDPTCPVRRRDRATATLSRLRSRPSGQRTPFSLHRGSPSWPSPRRRPPRPRAAAVGPAPGASRRPSRSLCPRCGATKVPHVVCGNCGWYAGRQAIEVD